MQLTFPSHKQVELSFKVSIAGTSSLPQSVTVVLEKNFVALSFIAKNVGDEWKAIIENPGKTFGDGEVKVSVNVILNNRLFVPMKGVGKITPDDEALDVSVDLTSPNVAVGPEVTATAEEPATPAVEVEDDDTEDVPAPTETVPAVKLDDVKEVPVVPKKSKYGSLLKMHELMHTEAVKKEEPKAPVQQPKPVIKTAIKHQPPKVQEKVEITAPVKMQLLKSIEHGNIAPAPKKVQESVQIKPPESVFKLKRVKIIQQ